MRPGVPDAGEVTQPQLRRLLRADPAALPGSAESTGYCLLDFVGEPAEVLVEAIEKVPLGLVRCAVAANLRGFRSVASQLCERSVIILHDREYPICPPVIIAFFKRGMSISELKGGRLFPKSSLKFGKTRSSPKMKPPKNGRRSTPL